MAKNVRRSKSSDSSDWIFITVLIVFLSLAFGTKLHDPFLHGVVAFFNGWDITSWESGLFTGSTEAMLSVTESLNPSVFSFWIFYMFPIIFIFVFVFVVSLFYTNRILRIVGAVVMALNIYSSTPEVPNSDAYNAAVYLTTRGWSDFDAFLFQYSVSILFIIIYSLYLYIIIDNNDRDALNRAKNLI